MGMIHGCINAEMLKHYDKQSVIDYLKSIDMTDDERRGFYDYWVSVRRHFR
jgi:hypothetical protein